MSRNDKEVLRELAGRYREIAELPVQDEKRALWSDHFELRKTRVPVLATYGMWNVWCREVFANAAMECEDEFYRNYERDLRMRIFQHEAVGDDSIQEPWLTVRAAVAGEWGRMWGVDESMHRPGVEGGAARFDPPLADWGDMSKLRPTPHEIDEQETSRRVDKLADAVGDILPIDVSRTPCYSGFMADISTCLGKLRGLETLMLDMYEHPDRLHALLALMRDGILANNQAAEEAGDYSLTSGQNQSQPYSRTLEAPGPNSGPRHRKDLWGFCAAQEFTLISPQFHDEFLFQYQKPIYEHFGLVHYGCCENLTPKIDMLRPLKNLRSIAVTPTADVAQWAEQIGTDYVLSWRPNPADMLCCGYDENLIIRIISSGLEACRGCYPHIHLKDIETVEGDPTRLRRWVALVRKLADGF